MVRILFQDGEYNSTIDCTQVGIDCITGLLYYIYVLRWCDLLSSTNTSELKYAVLTIANVIVVLATPV